MIRTFGLTKRYGTTVALNGVDLDIPDGAVYGLVGPNGAGKTTALHLLAGLISATSGTIETESQAVALLPDTPKWDPWLTGREVMELSSNLGSKPSSESEVDGLLSSAGIAEAAGRAVGGYSRGMLQRLGLAATLVGAPDILLLDEPASALDPQGRREVLDLVSRLRGEATVVFSSHILADVQEVCDTVGILRSGELTFQGPLAGLLVGEAGPAYVIRLQPPVDDVLKHLRKQDWVRDVQQIEPGKIRITVTDLDAAQASLASSLAESGATIISLVPEAPTLEDVFLEVVA